MNSKIPQWHLSLSVLKCCRHVFNQKPQPHSFGVYLIITNCWSYMLLSFTKGTFWAKKGIKFSMPLDLQSCISSDTWEKRQDKTQSWEISRGRCVDFAGYIKRLEYFGIHFNIRIWDARKKTGGNSKKEILYVGIGILLLEMHL